MRFNGTPRLLQRHHRIVVTTHRPDDAAQMGIVLG